LQFNRLKLRFGRLLPFGREEIDVEQPYCCRLENLKADKRGREWQMVRLSGPAKTGVLASRCFCSENRMKLVCVTFDEAREGSCDLFKRRFVVLSIWRNCGTAGQGGRATACSGRLQLSDNRKHVGGIDEGFLG
jgi:hypothetical protein